MRTSIILMAFVTVILSVSYSYAQIPSSYKGKPFRDKYYKSGAQIIPGRVELAYYDLGGEGVAYHDTTPENEGAALNHTMVTPTEGHLRPGISKYVAFFGTLANFRGIM